MNQNNLEASLCAVRIKVEAERVQWVKGELCNAPLDGTTMLHGCPRVAQKYKDSAKEMQVIKIVLFFSELKPKLEYLLSQSASYCVRGHIVFFTVLLL